MKVSILLASTAFASSVQALTGFGISMYDPNCACACRAAIAGATLACTQLDHRGRGHDGSGATTLQYYSEDTPFSYYACMVHLGSMSKCRRVAIGKVLVTKSSGVE